MTDGKAWLTAKFPGVWPDVTMDDLNRMDRPALAAWTRSHGLTVSPRLVYGVLHPLVDTAHWDDICKVNVSPGMTPCAGSLVLTQFVDAKGSSTPTAAEVKSKPQTHTQPVVIASWNIMCLGHGDTRDVQVLHDVIVQSNAAVVAIQELLNPLRRNV
jgi:hypothetical protein